MRQFWKPSPQDDRWHDLLSNRYVCECCLTRYFSPQRRCPACKQFGRIRPLASMLLSIADDDEDLRDMIRRGQTPLETGTLT